MAILLSGETAVDAMGSHRTDVLIGGERIAAVGPELEAPAGSEFVDTGGCLIMPGIDPHTHMEFHFMGMVTADGFECGADDWMAVVWTASVRAGRLMPSEFVAVTSTNIAKILNLYPKKGSLDVGAGADLVVWDRAATKTITANSQFSRIDYNDFEGFLATGLPRATLARRKIAWPDGDMRAKRCVGRYLARPALTPKHEALARSSELNRVSATPR